MNEYADAIEAIKELPAGIYRPQDFAFVAATTINNADSATGWTQANLVDGFIGTDAAIKVEGAASIKFRFNASASNGRASYEANPVVPRGAYHHVAVWVRWDRQFGLDDPADNVMVRVSSDSATLGGTYVEVPFPRIPQETWVRVIVPLGALTQVRSVGLIQTQPGIDNGLDWNHHWIDRIHFKELNEIEQALAEEATSGVIVAPPFVTGGTEGITEPDPLKTVVELRSNRQYITGLGGVRDIREWGIVDDGSVDVTADLMAIINGLPDDSTLRLTANAKYLVNEEIRVIGLNDVTIDGQGATLFTTRRRGQGAVKPDDAIIYVSENSNLTIRNLNVFGFRETLTTGANLQELQGPTSIHASDAAVRVLSAQNESVMVPRNISLGSYHTWYSRNEDREWRWEITLSRSGAAATDAEIKVELVEYDNNVTQYVVGTFDTQVVTPPQYPATQTYVVTGRPTDAQLRLRVRVSVRKVAATVNDVNVHSTKEFGRCEYEGEWDNGPGILIQRGSNYLVEDCLFEGMGTDAVQCIGGGNKDGTFLSGVTIRRVIARACNRHGFDFDWGEDALFEDLRSIGCGYHGMDIEPYDVVANPPEAPDFDAVPPPASSYAWYVKRITLRNIHFDGGLFAAIGAASWSGIEDLTIENVRYGRFHSGFIAGGALNLKISGVYSDGNCTDQESNEIRARHALITDCSLGGGLLLKGEQILQHRDGHNRTGVTLSTTTGDMLAVNCKIAPPYHGGSPTTALSVVGTTSRMIDVMAEDEAGVRFYNDASRSIRLGTGSPESVVTASPGSLFLRTNGGAGTSMYVKETGTGNTGWVAK